MNYVDIIVLVVTILIICLLIAYIIYRNIKKKACHACTAAKKHKLVKNYHKKYGKKN